MDATLRIAGKRILWYRRAIATTLCSSSSSSSISPNPPTSIPHPTTNTRFSHARTHAHTHQASRKGKTNNWNTINKKVLKKLKINIPANVIDAIVTGVSGVVEVVLIHIRNAILRITKPDGWQKTTREESEDEFEEPEPVARAPTEISEKELILGKKKKKKGAGGTRAKKDAGGSGGASAEGGVALPDINAKPGGRRKKRGAVASI